MGKRKSLVEHRNGSAGYTAPELTRDGVLVGPEIDMWAFGILLYEMCVAYKPTAVK